MERRALRRAADLALLTSLGSAAPSRAGGPADQDFEYRGFEPVATYDQESVTEPIPVAAAEELAPEVGTAHSDDYGWVGDDQPDVEGIKLPPERPVDIYYLVPEHADEPDVVEDIDPAPAPQPDDRQWDEFVADALPQVEPRPLPARPLAEPPIVPPPLDFALDYQPMPWYRSKAAAAVLVAAVVAVLLGAGWLVLRSPSTTAEQSAVEATTSAASAPTSAKPTAASAPMRPAPAPPPPPPPPPAEPVYSGPQRQYSPQYSEPTPAEKPRVDVTRAPMSVAPVPKPVPGSDHNVPSDTPGQQPRRHGCFGFC